MSDLANLSVAEFENRLRNSFNWISINREAMNEIAQALRSAADHIEQVGWTQHKNFENPNRQKTSPCCAVGALHAVVGTGSGLGVDSAVWAYESLARHNLVDFNDYVATDPSQVTTSLRTVADSITRYLEATNV